MTPIVRWSFAAALAVAPLGHAHQAAAADCHDDASIVRVIVLMKQGDASMTDQNFLSIFRTGHPSGYQATAAKKSIDDAALTMIHYATEHAGDGPDYAADGYYRHCVSTMSASLK